MWLFVWCSSAPRLASSEHFGEIEVRVEPTKVCFSPSDPVNVEESEESLEGLAFTDGAVAVPACTLPLRPMANDKALALAVAAAASRRLTSPQE